MLKNRSRGTAKATVTKERVNGRRLSGRRFQGLNYGFVGGSDRLLSGFCNWLIKGLRNHANVSQRPICVHRRQQNAPVDRREPS